MKLKALLFSIIFAISSFACAQAPKEITEAKESLTQMVALLDQNNFKDLVINYAYIPAEEKAEFIAVLETGMIAPPPEALEEMKTVLSQALETDGVVVGEEVIFTLEDGTPLTFAKEDNVWKLKN